MKRLPVIAGLLGLALAIYLILRQGVAPILASLDRAGWALLWLIPYHLFPLLLDAAGWRVLLRPDDAAHRARLPFLLWVATVREAVNRLLPVASVGGELLGIRLVMRRGLPGPEVSASVVVEVLLTLVSQYLFTALGLALMVELLQHTPVGDALWLGLLASLPVPILFFLVLRHGRLFSRVERLALHLLGDDHRLTALLGGAAALDARLHALFARPLLLTRALAWQLAGMIAGSVETWFVLHLFGAPVSAWEALTIESLTLALRHFAFFVPGGIGVQEGGFILFGHLLGLSADLAVALSLAKRLREIGFGLPALASWQWLEFRRLRSGTPGSA
jgi:putative membrane protein